MPGLLLPTASNVRPSYKSGFARSAAESSSPGLWDGMLAWWGNGLGVTGQSFRNHLDNSEAVYNTTYHSNAVDSHGPHTQMTGNAAANGCSTTWDEPISGDVTLVGWCRMGSGSGVYGRVADFNYQTGIWLGRSNSDSLGGGIRESGSPYGLYIAASQDVWYQVVNMRRGSTQYVMLNGGESITSQSVTTVDITSTTVMQLGASSFEQNEWDGGIGDVAIWDRALTENEIRQLYRDPLAPFRLRRFTPTYPTAAAAAATTSVGWTRSLTPSPVRPSYKSGFARSAAESASPGLWDGMVGAWCPELGNTGGTAHDVVNGNDGTLTYMDSATDWVRHENRLSLYFTGTAGEGSAEHVLIPRTDHIAFGSAGSGVDYTVSVWINRDATQPSGYGPFLNSGGQTADRIYLLVQSNGDLQQFNDLIATINIAADTWYHVVFTRTGTSGRWWVNGVDAGGGTITQTDIGSDWQWGRSGGTHRYKGYSTDLMMFRRVLQPSEIRQLHSDPLAPFRQRRFTPTYSPVAEEAAATTTVGWTRSLTPSPVRPSYKSGFARSAAESAYPGLWKNLSGAWCPALGNTGTTIHNRSPDSGIPDCSLTNTEAGDWQVGPYGHEIAFDGVNEYGNIVYHERLKPGTLSWSVAYAAYLPDANAEAPVYAYRMSSSPWKQIQFGFGTILSNGTLSTSKKIYIVIYAGGSEKYFANTDDDIADGAWHSVVFVRDCNEDVCRIYVDGEEKSITIASVAGTGLKSDVDTNLPTQWGRNNTSSYLQYDWATGFVWKRALEGSEAKVLGVDPLAPFRQRRFTPTISGAAEAAAGWQPYWAPRMTQRIIGSGVR